MNCYVRDKIREIKPLFICIFTWFCFYFDEWAPFICGYTWCNNIYSFLHLDLLRPLIFDGDFFKYFRSMMLLRKNVGLNTMLALN